MALSLPTGLTPPEIAFLCENELVTVIPRQRLESLELLSGPTPALTPPRTAPLPLWLALLLHRQRRANIVPPPWLSPSSLDVILKAEIANTLAFSDPPAFPIPPACASASDAIPSPPFIPDSTADAADTALPYHWIELGEVLLAHSPESFGAAASSVRGLLRDLREVRMSKLRAGMQGLEGGGLFSLRGVGATEVAQERGFVVGVMGGLRVLGASREAARREGAAEGGGDGGGGGFGDEEDDDDMEL